MSTQILHIFLTLLRALEVFIDLRQVNHIRLLLLLFLLLLLLLLLLLYG